jgi:putative restriction endonuclease
MTVRLLVAVTDRDWFEHLRTKPALSEVNFWAPGAASFRALEAGELFLFKLHAPLNFIVGGGVFTYANTLPCSLAWEAFHEGNGAPSLVDMACTRFRRHRVRCFDGAGGGSWRDGSLPASSSLRPCG